MKKRSKVALFLREKKILRENVKNVLAHCLQAKQYTIEYTHKYSNFLSTLCVTLLKSLRFFRDGAMYAFEIITNTLSGNDSYCIDFISPMGV